jgi:hypothetical protein
MQSHEGNHKLHGHESRHGMTDTTTISLQKETRDILWKLGSKGQTYDKVIRELVKRASIKGLDIRWNRILEEEEFVALQT